MRFNKPKNALEGQARPLPDMSESATEPLVVCNKCKKALTLDELEHNLHVCPYCRNHFMINARQRIHLIADAGSFVEFDQELQPTNILGFPDYDKKLEVAHLQSAENDSVVSGECTIEGRGAVLFVMDPYFMMGSMGSIAGEKITRAFERATVAGLPVIGFTASGGARMQEGVVSLMQMAKTSGAVRKHSDAGNLFVSVLTDPTTGGVTASFAMEADIILAEPYALIGFAGPRVIEQTIRKKLPAGFQRAEFQLEHGFLDDIVGRKRQRPYLAQLLEMHHRERGQA
ncbi:MAG: acetyl-CoA carboxylase, carboxyltransferase subunit beta [Coriobacteriia bacterium]|nr:acetyl-CoA carboxylase, carboxyltransferase subunit beta [Coriobacteriia bacterium]